MPPGGRLRISSFTPAVFKNGCSVYADGTAGLLFDISVEPGVLSSRLEDHFTAAGWHERHRQFMNPQMPTSFERGWDPISGRFLVWHGEWEDDQGNIVTYEFGGRSDELHGDASYLPRTAVEAIGRKIQR